MNADAAREAIVAEVMSPTSRRNESHLLTLLDGFENALRAERLPTAADGPWTADEHTTIDKSFRVTGPGDVVLYVDYDDVNHPEVDAVVSDMLVRLNTESDVPVPSVNAVSGERPVWSTSQIEAAAKVIAAGLLFTARFDDVRVDEFKALCDRMAHLALDAALRALDA